QHSDIQQVFKNIPINIYLAYSNTPHTLSLRDLFLFFCAIDLFTLVKRTYHLGEKIVSPL
ncbi:hypothetical protein, partial [Parabacteroides sp. CH2-D42-20]|uniref:hypothetical protein n=1 Tax=Parabacteroides sp. CH2-D42-20 TaxID=2320086 RepID=UPI001F3D4FC5